MIIVTQFVNGEKTVHFGKIKKIKNLSLTRSVSFSNRDCANDYVR